MGGGGHFLKSQGATLEYVHHLPHRPSEFTRLIIYKFYLRNKPNLHIISSFAYQGKQLDEIHSVV